MMPFRAASVVCLVVRTGLALLAKWAPRHWLPWMGAIALLPSAGFFLIYAMGWRRTGAEVGGGRIWWNDLRPVHGALYLAFAVLALRRSGLAYVPLAIDVLLGLSAYLVVRSRACSRPSHGGRRRRDAGVPPHAAAGGRRPALPPRRAAPRHPPRAPGRVRDAVNEEAGLRLELEPRHSMFWSRGSGCCAANPPRVQPCGARLLGVSKAGGVGG